MATTPIEAASVARGYHEAWTSRDFATVGTLLAPDLVVEVPVNEYPTAASFAAAVEAFGSKTSDVELLAEFANDGEAMLLYDLEVESLGKMRVAEHFTVENGRIKRIRQIHDTAALRAAGFAPEFQPGKDDGER